MTNTDMPDNKTGAGEVTIIRFFDAPRELVWRAWTDPEHHKKWWGPKDFTAPHCEIDLKVGGKHLYCMRSADGENIWNSGEFLEVVHLKKLVYTEYFADENGNEISPVLYGFPEGWNGHMVVTVIFEDEKGKTKITALHAGLPTGDLSMDAKKGWNESLDKLADSLK